MSATVLLALACKTGLVAALALAGAAVLRARPAGERVALLRLGLVLVALAPLVSQQIPALRVEAPAAFAPRPAASTGPAETVVMGLAEAAPAGLVPAEAPAAATVAPSSLLRADPWTVVAAVYVTGAGLLLLRLGFGVAVLMRQTREARPVEDARWLAALDRAAGTGPRPRLKVSPRPLAPLSWGLRPGVILIGPDALGQAERADAVLTHELAHIRHGDWAFLMLSRLLIAALWFNPLIWLLARELSRQSEFAADAWAVRRVPRLDYAGALVALARSGGPRAAPSAAAMGMADSELARRVKTVLVPRTAGGRPWAATATAAACLGLAGPLAALELAPAAVRDGLAPLATPPSYAPQPTAAPTPNSLRADAFGGRAATSAPSATTAASAPVAAPGVASTAAPGVENLRAGADALASSAAFLRAQAADPNLRPHERARLQQEAAEVDARAAHMRMQAGTIAARHAAHMQSQTHARSGASTDVRLTPGAFIGAEDMRNAANQMRADAAGMKVHADSLASGALPSPPGGEAEIEAMRGQAEALRRQADELDRQAEALGPP